MLYVEPCDDCGLLWMLDEEGLCKYCRREALRFGFIYLDGGPPVMTALYEETRQRTGAMEEPLAPMWNRVGNDRGAGGGHKKRRRLRRASDVTLLVWERGRDRRDMIRLNASRGNFGS